ETVLMDYTRPETVRDALRGVERVFLVGPPLANLAALASGVDSAAARAGVTPLVKLSALGGRQALFPGLHRDSEERIEASDVPYTFLRPNGFMQNLVTYNGDTLRTQDACYAAKAGGTASHS